MRVCFICWNEKKSLERISLLTNLGVEVLEGIQAGPQFAKDIESAKPDVLLIDLSRLPSQGRDLGVMIRARAGTRQIPIVFVEGADDKVAAIRGLLPDAEFTHWTEISSALNRAITTKDHPFLAHSSVFAAYSQKPLAAKLGIKAGYQVCLVGESKNLIRGSETLPDGVQITTEIEKDADIYIWCLHSLAELAVNLEMIKKFVQHSPTWVAWPKKSAAIKSDLDQTVVRKKCMAAGMVDYKICSINEQWSALLFSWRG